MILVPQLMSSVLMVTSHTSSRIVIASVAKQSSDRAHTLDCFVAGAPRRDGECEKLLLMGADGKLPDTERPVLVIQKFKYGE